MDPPIAEARATLSAMGSRREDMGKTTSFSCSPASLSSKDSRRCSLARGGCRKCAFAGAGMSEGGCRKAVRVLVESVLFETFLGSHLAARAAVPDPRCLPLDRVLPANCTGAASVAVLKTDEAPMFQIQDCTPPPHSSIFFRGTAHAPGLHVARPLPTHGSSTPITPTRTGTTPKREMQGRGKGWFSHPQVYFAC